MGGLTIGSVLIGSFIACAVEVTEMVVIVVGVGTTRGWRSTLVGAGCGLAVLAALVAGLGQALSLVPIDPLRVAIGGLLLTFGLQWLTQGVIGVASDGLTGGEEDEGAGPGGARRGGLLDWTAWLLAFKGVTLEGLEVAFIVIAFGAGSRGGQGGYLDAFVGAAAAFVVVGSAGALSINRVKKVPGRTLKFGVGGLISTFGTFWALEGLGVHWPGGRLSLAWLYALYLTATVALAALARLGVLGPRPYPTVLGDTGPAGPLGLAPASARSIRLFQRRRGIEPSGDIDEPTRAAVRAELAEREEPADSGWSAVGVDPTSDESVRAFQRRFDLPSTGIVDAATRGALRVLQRLDLFDGRDEEQIRRFQRGHDLSVTGTVDERTRAAARAVAAGAADTDRPGGADVFAVARRFDAADPGSVQAFQSAFHLEADGVVGDETRGALRAVRAVIARLGLDRETAPRPDAIEPDPADAEAVRSFQQEYGLPADGSIGPLTRQALLWQREHLLGVDVSSPESVRSFQRRHGLADDGVVGPETQVAMIAARRSRQPSAGDGRKRYGRAGRHGAGFGVGLDPADAGSVEAFQREHGLRPDGIIGARTQAALRALRAERRRRQAAGRKEATAR